MYDRGVARTHGLVIGRWTSAALVWLIASSGDGAQAQAPASSGTVITVAGNGSTGFSGDGGLAIDAILSGPYATTVGPDGTFYIADSANYRIRAVDPNTGIISTVAGNGSELVDDGPNGDGGPAASAQIGSILALGINRDTNTLYFPNFGLGRVRGVNLTSGIISNVAGTGYLGNPPGWLDGDGGPATSAYLVFPIGTDVGPDGDVFITDYHRLRRVDTATGIIDSIAGIEDEHGQPVLESTGDGGPAIEASFNYPHNLRVDSEGNVFVLDLGNDGHLVRRIDADTGIITRVAGGGANSPTAGGQATDINFTSIWDIAPDSSGNLFIADGVQVFKLVLATGEVTTYAGTGTGGFDGDGGPAIDAQFGAIVGMAAVPGGGLLLADSDNSRVRYIAPESINLVGNGGVTEFQLPWVNTLTGDLVISDNPNMTGVNAVALISVTGSLSITSNDATGLIDLPSLNSVTGDLTITDNGNTSVNVGAVEEVTGNVTLESTGTGTFNLSGAEVTGDTDLSVDGYTAVEALTADGSTAVTMINNESTMYVTLPDGAFTSETPVSFTITSQPGSVETIGDDIITHLASYTFEFAIPSLDSPAELSFEIDLAAMDESSRQSLLGLLDMDVLLTLGVRGDEPDSELQLFDVCPPGVGPEVDDCVAVQWLDENRIMLDPQGGIDPSCLRLEGLVGHFSTYSFVAVTPVPEPASLTLLVLCTAALLPLRRR